ncbi:MAG TPA: potassium-transporting ATPase subunit C [Clostridiales bacterium]|nr:potassium-transporting ATPase subunit C [Clostridiales bacterium]
MSSFLKTLKNCFVLTIVLLVLCSIIYPLTLTGVSQLAFNYKANGSLIEINGKIVGSELIGQNFTDSRFFRGRISSVNYNSYTSEDLKNDLYSGVASGSFNYGATNINLHDRVKNDIDEFLKAHSDVKKEDIPADLLTASGSGLDPHISPSSAIIQIPAISKATGLSESQLEKIVEDNTEHKIFGVYGEEVVNVFKANLDIAKLINIID